MPPKSIKLTSESELEAVHEFIIARTQFRKDLALLQLRHTRELNDLQTLYKKQFRDCFRKATVAHLPDPDEVFNNQSQLIHLDFFEAHGDAYLVDSTPAEDLGFEEEPAELAGSPRKVIVN